MRRILIASTAFAIAGLVAVAAPPSPVDFLPAVPIAAAGNPLAVAVADVTGDGANDIVLAMNRAAKVTVLPGQGDGTFGTPIDVTVGSESYSTRVRTARLNGDAAADVVVDHQGSPKLDVLLSDGAGGFTVAPYTASTAADPYVYPSLADWDGDGANDIVAASFQGKIRVLRNQGSGTFAAASDITVAGTAPSMARGCVAADLDGDGDTDVVTADTANVNVFWQESDGTLTVGPKLARPPAITSALQGKGLVAADFDGDGRTDIAVMAEATATVGAILVYLRTGATTFAAATQFDTASVANSWDLAAADLTGDGRPEIVTPSDLLVNLGDGTFAPPLSYLSAYGWGVAAGNVDADPRADIVLANFLNGAVVLQVRNSAASPAVTALVPSTLHLGATRDVTVSGSGFRDGAVLDFGPGITVLSSTVVSEASVEVRVSVAEDAAPGLRSLSLVNAGGGAASLPFTVATGGAATIAALVPDRAHAGDTLEVVLQGEVFVPAVGVAFGAGVVTQSVEFLDAQSIRVEVTLLSDASVGDRDVTVTNGTGVVTTATGAFRVLPQRSLDLTAETGLYRGSPRPRHGAISVGGTLSFNEHSPDGRFLPVTESAELRIGPSSAPLVVSIPADTGWRLRGGMAMWRSPRDAVPQVRVRLDLARERFRIALRRADLPRTATTDVLVELTLGGETGTSVRQWRASRGGSTLTLRSLGSRK